MPESDSPGEVETQQAVGQYVVVARRYRPQDFDDLVGQKQVSTALANAINTNRVGHAYLFTGARGVGKTSTARILAKCLNCVHGPTPEPCGACDSCVSIAAGEDVDVLEIDGASNRGIDEIRQLRSNVNIRPSRSRFKVYIIDEVHMLTTPAFNALLKTLEEPPEHVKFIFCTTDPEKIPITVISRCQRFDFTGIQTNSIIDRLRHIVDQEKANVDDAALALLARRAGGSMRDSQSLLEQLLAFGGETITVDDVHRLLGTADSGRVWQILRSVVANNAAQALAEFDLSIADGADSGQVIEQLAGCFRDIMARQVGCTDEVLLNSGSEDLAELEHSLSDVSLPNVLAALQMLDEALLRMRQSTQTRTVAETTLVRIACLEQLDNLGVLVGQLRSGGRIDSGDKSSSPPTGRTTSAQKKTPDPTLDAASSSPEPIATATQRVSQRIDNAHSTRADVAPSASTMGDGSNAASRRDSDDNSQTATQPSVATQASVSTGIELSAGNVERIWKQVLEDLDGMTQLHASRCISPAISGPNRLAIRFPATYTSSKAYCERPQRRQELETALQKVVGKPVRVELELTEATAKSKEPKRPKLSQTQLRKQVAAHPLVQKAAQVFDGTVIAVEPPQATARNNSAD